MQKNMKNHHQSSQNSSCSFKEASHQTFSDNNNSFRVLDHKSSNSSIHQNKVYLPQNRMYLPENKAYLQENKSFSHENYQNSHAQCQLCLSKSVIIEQLQKLKVAVQAKNQRIKELEQFIHKISKMAFMDSIETNYTNQDMKSIFQLPTKIEEVNQYTDECEDEITFNKMNGNKENSQNTIELRRQSDVRIEQKKSQVMAEELASNRTDLTKYPLKEAIQNMKLEKRSFHVDHHKNKDEMFGSSSSELRNKFLQIMSINQGQGYHEGNQLREGSSQHEKPSTKHHHSLGTESDLQSQGQVGQIHNIIGEDDKLALTIPLLQEGIRENPLSSQKRPAFKKNL